MSIGVLQKIKTRWKFRLQSSFIRESVTAKRSNEFRAWRIFYISVLCLVVRHCQL